MIKLNHKNDLMFKPETTPDSSYPILRELTGGASRGEIDRHFVTDIDTDQETNIIKPPWLLLEPLQLQQKLPLKNVLGSREELIEVCEQMLKSDQWLYFYLQTSGHDYRNLRNYFECGAVATYHVYTQQAEESGLVLPRFDEELTRDITTALLTAHHPTPLDQTQPELADYLSDEAKRYKFESQELLAVLEGARIVNQLFESAAERY